VFSVVLCLDQNELQGTPVRRGAETPLSFVHNSELHTNHISSSKPSLQGIINQPSFSLPLRLFSSDTDAHAIFYVTFLLVISGYWAMVISYSIALLICWITLVFFPDWNNQASFAFGVNVKLCCPNHSTPSGVAMYSIPKTYAASAAVSSMQTCERY
jgi:hypothetical protein